MVKSIGPKVPASQNVPELTAKQNVEAKKVTGHSRQSSYSTGVDPTTPSISNTSQRVVPSLNGDSAANRIGSLTPHKLAQMSFDTSPSTQQAESIQQTGVVEQAGVGRPELQPLTIKGSVGRKGKNRPEDVQQVRNALQAVGYLPAGDANAPADEALFDAIANYQRDNNLPVVDGRIDVSKYTMNHINRKAQGGESPAPNRQQSRPALQTPGFPPMETLLPGFPPALDSNPTPSASQQNPSQQSLAPQPSLPVQQVAPMAPLSGPADAELNQLQQRSINHAIQEWQSGVREQGGRNRGPRVDQYARNSKMRPGGEWCGFFTSFNYAQNGFKDSPSLASYQKARDYFMYRTYTSNTGSAKNQENDAVRAQHAQQGSSRQYFMLEESPTRRRVTRNGQWGNQRYGHYNADSNTFNFQSLPVRSGDTVLFNHGHVGMVESYNPATGTLTTIEGNTSGMGPDGRRRSQAVVRKTYDLSDPSVRRLFDGFGRPSRFDFE